MNNYIIESQEDIYNILESLGNNPLYFFDAELVNRIPIYSPKHYIKIEYREDYYRISSVYAHTKPFEINYLKLNIPQVIKFLWLYKEFNNYTQAIIINSI